MKYTEDWEGFEEEKSARQKYYEETNFKTKVCPICSLKHDNYKCLNDLI